MPIGKFNTHDLRRSMATMMTKLGLPLELTAMIVGHTAGGAGTQTLVRHYVFEEFIDRKADGLAIWDGRLREILAWRESEKVMAASEELCWLFSIHALVCKLITHLKYV